MPDKSSLQAEGTRSILSALWNTQMDFLTNAVATKASLIPQQVKNLPAMQETWVRSLGWKDPLKKGKATHSSILAWRIPWIV